MRMFRNRPLPRAHRLLFCLLLALVGGLAGTSRHVSAACGGVTNVSSEVELNGSIADFNGQSGPCHYTIALTSDIYLDASTLTIDNPAQDVDLLLAGDGNTVSGQGNPGVRPFTIASDTTVAMLSLNMVAGNAINGGGIHNSGELTVTGGVIALNHAAQEGGGIWNGATGTLTVQGGTQIVSNLASIANATNDAQGGGGIFNNGGTVHISGANISNNTVDGMAWIDDGGGGIFNDGRNSSGAVTLIDTTVNGNTAITSLGNGGGILNIGLDSTPTVTISGGTISDNEAARAGGGIESNRGTLVLEGVSVSGNTTGLNGGGLHTTGDDLVTISGSTISGNVSGQEGGGVWNSATGTMTIQSGTTIDGNTANSGNATNDAQGGGGVFNNGGSLTISDATISNNVAEGSVGPDDGGGGVFNDGRNAPGTVTIANTTVSGNMAPATWGNGAGILSVGDADTTPMLTVTASLIDDNHATRAGGGIESYRGVLMLDDVTVSNNTTGVNGGGVHTTGFDTATISGGIISANIAGHEGGGVWNSATGAMTIQGGTLIDGNTANIASAATDAQGGGGVFNNGGSLTIDSATIRNNTVDGSAGTDDGGAGIFNDGRNTPGSVSLVNTTVSGNTALSGTGSGGGILNLGIDSTPSVTVSGGLIDDNHAARAGGGIETNQGTIQLNDVTVSNNSAMLNGGGIHVTSAGTVTIERSVMRANSADNEGGGLWLANSGDAFMSIIASSIVDNEANAGGGGIFNDGGSGELYLENSTLSGNTVSAGDGGGLDSEGGEVWLRGVTIADNLAAGDGGGLSADPGTLLRVTATLIGDNIAGGSGSDVSGAFTAVNTTLLENGAGTSGIAHGTDGNIVGVDGGLQPLGEYGSATPLHALESDSPALDAAADSGLSTDQRGVPRPQGAADDMGAYELSKNLYLPAIFWQ